MKYLLPLFLLCLISCKSDQKKREDLILGDLVKNAYSEDWRENKKNRAKILKYEIEITGPLLWQACDSIFPLEIVYHLENLDILKAYSDEKWEKQKNNIRENCIDNLTNKSSDLRLEALKKLMLFGKLVDIPAVIPLLKDDSLKICKQAQGTLIQLGAPYRVDLVRKTKIPDDEIDAFIEYFSTWYQNNNKNTRGNILWQSMSKSLPSHHKQTVVNGLIGLTCTRSSNKKQAADIVWKQILRELNANVRDAEVVLLGSLRDPKYIDPLIDTGWLSKGNIESRIRVSWALNQMGYPNNQPHN